MHSCACGNLAEVNGTMCHRCAALHELGLKAGATDAEVKTAYRLYVKAWHPDRFPGDEKSKGAAQEKLKAINSAYDYLTSSSSKGQTHRPKTSTPPSQPQEPNQQKQSSAKQPPPAGGCSQEPLPKPNTGNQDSPRQPSATPPPPSYPMARRWGLLLYLTPVLLWALLSLWGAISTSSNQTTPPADSATTASAFQPRPTVQQLNDIQIDGIKQQVETLLDQSRYAEAAPLFGQACDAGKARGCADLAYLYDHGNGVTQDESRAVTLATKACKAGDAYGCDSIGILYEDGRGVTLDHSRAAEFYAKACKGRFSDGCYNLGLMYDNGHGVAKGPSQAAAFYFKACNAGRAEGCNQLGYMYDNGLGVAKDNEKTRQFLTRGCKLGNKWGCDRLKEMQ